MRSNMMVHTVSDDTHVTNVSGAVHEGPNLVCIAVRQGYLGISQSDRGIDTCLR